MGQEACEKKSVLLQRIRRASLKGLNCWCEANKKLNPNRLLDLGFNNKRFMTKNLENVVRKNVLQLINKHDINKQQMALELGMDPGHLSRVISGKRSVTMEHVEKWAVYFEISAAELMSEPHVNVKCGDDQVIRIDLHVPHYDAYIRLKRMIQELY